MIKQNSQIHPTNLLFITNELFGYVSSFCWAWPSKIKSDVYCSQYPIFKCIHIYIFMYVATKTVIMATIIKFCIV